MFTHRSVGSSCPHPVVRPKDIGMYFTHRILAYPTASLLLLVFAVQRCTGFIATTLPPKTSTANRSLLYSTAFSGGMTMFDANSHRRRRALETPPTAGHIRSSVSRPRYGDLFLARDIIIDTEIVDDGEEEPSYVGVDFERQELRVIFETMDKNNVFYKMLSEEQITEILTLTQALLRVKQMPVDISQLRQGDAMKGKWKLEFSTEERYKLLPPATDIYNYIYDGYGEGRLDNIIRFYKSWTLKNVRAVTKYTMDRRGKIVFYFERIEADLCGFKIPLPKFGQDAGYVEIQYFDGELWVEAFDAPSEKDPEQMQTVLNIYRRVGDATEQDKASIPERTGDIGLAQR